jgi:divalent metal cation (Fe/Co/Zn/Cd) transporter
VGQAATPGERAQILAVLDERPEVEEVLQLLTMALSPERLLVAARIDISPGIDSEAFEEASTAIDRAIRERVATVAEVFLDATDRERFAEARRRPLGLAVPSRAE